MEGHDNGIHQNICYEGPKVTKTLGIIAVLALEQESTS
jgi:hypothetical protein